jgi:hypothetical protein
MKTGAHIAAFLAVTLTAAAQTNGPGLASTVVGYHKVTAPQGLNLVRVDFHALSNGTYTAGTLIGPQLPTNSQVSIYERGTGTYLTETNDPILGWPTGTNAHAITRTVGFWLNVPTNAASNAYQVYFTGLVPDTNTAPTTTVQGITSNSTALVGYGYPASIWWTNTRLVVNTQAISMQIWNLTSQAYDTYNKSGSGWDAGTNVVIKPGVGFWFTVDAVTQDWVETKPYTWP